MIVSNTKTTDRAAKPGRQSFKPERPNLWELESVAIALLAIGLCNGTAQAQHSPGIASITICTPAPTAPGAVQGQCAPGFDTQQPVLGPTGPSVNRSGLGVEPAPDEHSTVFGPGTLGANQDYLFFLASTEGGYGGFGVAVLSGGTGPSNGTWTLNFPYADGYGFYSGGVGFGQVFNHPTNAAICPTVPDGNAKEQDETFDMHYAAPGSMVTDPTGPPGSLLMVYEGANSCIGNAGVPGQPTGPATGDSYISLAIATSLDYGKSWPTYRGNTPASFPLPQFPLPGTNPTQSPNTGVRAYGPDVCIGNDCTTTPPASYGRYAVVTPTMSLDSLMQKEVALANKYGEQEISGFVDDVGSNKLPFLYVNSGDVRVAQAQLNGSTALLQFSKWDPATRAFDIPGLGGDEFSVLPTGAFANCEAPSQNQIGSSISYVDSTQQYLLTFVCVSLGDPSNPGLTPQKGAAWFYSTSNDLTDQSKWSTPTEILGSWNTFGSCGNDNPDPYYNGWYPTFMSLNKKPGHLSMTGYVFYLTGCQGGGTPSGRQLTSRAFIITRAVPPGQ